MPNFKFVLAAVIVCFAQLSSVTHADTLVLNNAAAPPLTNDEKTGFLDIIVGEAFRRSGVELSLIKLPAERGLKNADDGIDDGDLIRIGGLEKEYPNLISVPEKIFDMDFVAFTNKPGVEVASWDGLKDHVVGIITGWKIFENNIPEGTDFISVHDADQLFSLLEKGRIDVALYSRLMGLALIKRRKIDGIRVLTPPLATKEMFIYLHKRHRDVAGKIADSIAALKEEGVYDQEYRKIKARLK